MRAKWAVFCRVVDNFGDIGVCWRLARQLANEMSLDVTLWVDDLASFAKIRSEIDPLLVTQTLEKVTVKHWPNEFPHDEVAADVVIEAFACDMPPPYIAQMQARAISPIWINLEYLSAEDWVEGCHGLPSPVHGLNKYFFFPGFTRGTGGVLSEASQRLAQAAWQAADAITFLSQLAPNLPVLSLNALTISLFAYEPEVIADWLNELKLSAIPICLFVPEGRVLPQVLDSILTSEQHYPGVYSDGALTVQVLPMLSQDDYDKLLWSCDINFVRGEDSFVRAQWAAKPFIWHIYPQDDDAHRDKLDAFLARYADDETNCAQQAIAAMMQVWNHGGDVVNAWRNVLAHRQALTLHAEEWQQQLAELGDLATNLAQFVAQKSALNK